MTTLQIFSTINPGGINFTYFNGQVTFIHTFNKVSFELFKIPTDQNAVDFLVDYFLPSITREFGKQTDASLAQIKIVMNEIVDYCNA